VGVYLGGLTGLSLGWFIAMSIEVALMSPTVYKATRLPKQTRPKTRAELFAEELENLATPAFDAQAGWQSDTLIQPVWVADTLTLNAIVLPKRPTNSLSDTGIEPVDQRPTLHMTTSPWYAEQATIHLPNIAQALPEEQETLKLAVQKPQEKYRAKEKDVSNISRRQ
jgi:hypothetical protein